MEFIHTIDIRKDILKISAIIITRVGSLMLMPIREASLMIFAI